MAGVRAPRPLVSILVPVYNRADLLGPCLDSARAQVNADFEIVVADNASTDGTWEICWRIAAEDARVRVFRNDSNVGPVRNWERCLAGARGTYAKLLFSDDTIAPYYLSETVPWLLDPSIGFVYTAARVGPSSESATITYEWPAGPGRHLSRDFIRASLAGDDHVPVSPGCALFRLADLQSAIRHELPLSPPRDLTADGAGADLLLYLTTAHRYPYFASVAKPASFFRVHEDSITIDGRAGEVALGYVLTRLWFGQTFGYSGFLGRQRRRLAGIWLSDVAARRRWVGPAQASARFGSVVGPGGLMSAAAAYVCRSLARRVVRRIRRLRRTPAT